MWRIVHIYLSLFVTNCGLVRSDSGLAATKPPFPGRYGRRFQFLAKAGGLPHCLTYIPITFLSYLAAGLSMPMTFGVPSKRKVSPR